MNKQHILGFFDDLVRTPAFLFLCAMFLCGAVAGGLTGLRASEGDSAVELTAFLAQLPGQALKSVLCALLWIMLAPLCALLRPAPLFLSAVVAARGFVLALTMAVGLGQEEGALLSLGMAALPASDFPSPAPGSGRLPKRLPSTAARPSPNAMQNTPSAPTNGRPIPNENRASSVSDAA